MNFVQKFLATASGALVLTIGPMCFSIKAQSLLESLDTIYRYSQENPAFQASNYFRLWRTTSGDVFITRDMGTSIKFALLDGRDLSPKTQWWTLHDSCRQAVSVRATSCSAVEPFYNRLMMQREEYLGEYSAE